MFRNQDPTPGATEQWDLAEAEADAEPEAGRFATLLNNPWTVPAAILSSTLLLLGLGLMMVWSASSIISIRAEGSSTAMLTKQVMYAVVGLIAMAVVARLSRRRIQWLATPMLGVALLLLILVLIPGIGAEVYGQRNWINLFGPFRVQPSEIAKIALILSAASALARTYRPAMTIWDLLKPVLPAVVIIGLIALEKDFGNAMIATIILFIMLFVAGAPLRLFVVGGAVALAFVVIAVLAAPYRLQRITSFFSAGDSEEQIGGAWQVTQGSYALGTGGLFGVGLGAGREKWGSLPAAHTDFIFPVVGEELGLVGTVLVLMLFAILVLAIFRLIQITTDRFTQLVAAGVGGMIAIQVVTNVGGAIKMLPITGVTLPLLSYGGSSLIVTLVGIGFALALSRWVLAGAPAEEAAHADAGPPTPRQPKSRVRPTQGARPPLRQRVRSGSNR